MAMNFVFCGKRLFYRLGARSQLHSSQVLSVFGKVLCWAREQLHAS